MASWQGWRGRSNISHRNFSEADHVEDRNVPPQMLMSVPWRAVFLPRQNTCSGPHSALSSTKGDEIDWRQHLTSACQLTVLSSICTPDRDLGPRYMLQRASQALGEQNLQSCGRLLRHLPSSFLSSTSRFCTGLGRVAELHRGLQQSLEGNAERLGQQTPHGCSGPHSHRGTLPPRGHGPLSPRRLGKDMEKRLAASLMLISYTPNASASHMYFASVLKQGSVNLIYWG